MKNKTAHDKVNAEKQSSDSVEKVAKMGTRAPMRKGDNSNGEPYHQRMKVDKMAMEEVDKLVDMLDEDQIDYLIWRCNDDTAGDFAIANMAEAWAELTKDDTSLTENVKANALTLMEFAVKSLVNKEATAINEAQTELRLADNVKRNENVNKFLTTIVAEWAEHNKVPIENSINGKLAESFMATVKQSLSEHNVELDEDKVNILDEAQRTIEERTEIANKAIKELQEARDENIKYQSYIVIQEVAKELNLSSVQMSEMATVAKNVVFTEHDEFKAKLMSLSHLYKGDGSKTPITEKLANLAENTDDENPVNESVKRVNPIARAAVKANEFTHRHDTNKKETN